ncbi:hypothetical protein H7F15_19140 [Pontibacter sp. Tf4]|uniref:hypothetical protein n=1 Tax=Pontibacter sp. Tf4 TaxID=2761620 RepID=UPI00162794BD|nr:hypothetical protein [Pontibacter sp. Tf4]MBB6613163.1 hypothetical protein [Pontibacter sp. Tf4]
MDLYELVLGILFLLIGVLSMYHLLSNRKEEFIDKYGDNISMFAGAFMAIIVGMALLFRTLF